MNTLLRLLIPALFLCTYAQAELPPEIPRDTAESCTSVDLRGDKMGPIRDQGQAGDCFLEASLDLIHYNTGVSLSVPDAYFKYATHFGSSSEFSDIDELDRGGHGNAFFRFAREEKFCTAQDFPEHFNVVLNASPDKVVRTMDFADTNHYLASLQKTLRTGVNVLKNDYVQFPGVSYEQLISILYNYAGHEAWKQIIELSCGKKRISVPHYRVFPRSIIPFPSEYIFQPLTFLGNLGDLNKQLRKGNPVEISYDAQVINPQTIKPRSYHASVVVGRKFNAQTQTCEYLVRNSWGNHCYGYASDIKCESGYYWLTTEKLAHALVAIGYLK